MNVAVFDSLAPVVLLIASGVLAGRCGWLSQDAIKDLTQLIFYLLAPALLFRTMSEVRGLPARACSSCLASGATSMMTW